MTEEYDPFAFEETLLAGMVSQELRRIMEEEGVTQTELATRLGVSQPMISRTLARENMSLHTAARMACALGRRIDIHVVPR